MSPSLVSVVLPVHNRPQFLAEAAGSILSQTLRDLELIVVDDGSNNPDTPKVVAAVVAADSRIRAIRREVNGGPSAARNTGLAVAVGKYVAFMDDDDVSEPARLEKQVAFLDANPEVAAVNCAMAIVDESGRVRKLPSRESAAFSRPVPPLEDGDGRFAVLVNASAVVRRSALAEIGGYRDRFRGKEDFDLTLRMEEKFVLAGLPDALYRYRESGDGRVSMSPRSWRCFVAAMISAQLRRRNKPDPMAAGSGEPDDDFLLAHFGELSPQLRIRSMRKCAGPARRLLRAGRFGELREFLSLAAAMCAGDSERRALSRVRRRVLWWSLLFGKPGFWFSGGGVRS